MSPNVSLPPQPDLSIVVPCYNRGALLAYSLESVRRAHGDLRIELIVVDDGSEPALDPVLPAIRQLDGRVIRQPNQGLLFARLRGFAEVTGRYTLFLDSDDLVSPEKFRTQLGAMDRNSAEVSYSGTARATLEGDYDHLTVTADAPPLATSDSAEFFVTVQPAPHSPIFRTDYLRGIVRDAFFPPSPLYNSVAEIWFYHNAAPRPARVVPVPGPMSIIGQHPAARLTNQWERLAVASLAVMEAFARSVPATAEYARCRRLVGEKAFRSWRRLPRGFSGEIAARHLALWSRLAGESRDYSALGGAVFQIACRLLGPARAGRMFRSRQAVSYETIRTVTDENLHAWLAALPAP